MIGEFLLKKFIPQIVPHIKPGLKKLVDICQEYKTKIPLERGEIVVGLVMLVDEKFIVSSCVAKSNESGKLEIQRAVDSRDADYLAELLIKNIGNADFSAVLSSDDPEKS